MRTTLTIDDDVLTAVKARADSENLSIGAVLSSLARRALTTPSAPEFRNGLPLLQRQTGITNVTMQIVNELRDSEI